MKQPTYFVYATFSSGDMVEIRCYTKKEAKAIHTNLQSEFTAAKVETVQEARNPVMYGMAGFYWMDRER